MSAAAQETETGSSTAVLHGMVLASHRSGKCLLSCRWRLIAAENAGVTKGLVGQLPGPNTSGRGSQCRLMTGHQGEVQSTHLVEELS